MSMIRWMLGLPPAQIAALRANPSLASDLAGLTQGEALEARVTARMSQMPPEKREEAEAQYRASRERMPGAKEAEARKMATRARLERIGHLSKLSI